MTDRARLMELAARVEAASDNRILRDVFIALHKAEVISDGPYDAAMRLLNAGASLDAALSLYDEEPEMISTNPRLVVRDALIQKAKGMEHA